MILPIKSKNPPDSYPYATLALIAINIVVFFLTTSKGVIRLDLAFTYGIARDNIKPLPILAHMFLHANWLHLAGNMWFLYLFGFAVEGRLRTAKFLLLYFGAGLVAAALQMSVSAQPMIGASGAIMGTLGAALYIFPFAQMDFFLLMGFAYCRVVTWRMWGVALYYLGIDALEASVAPGPVANIAHLGGAAGGVLIALLMATPRDNKTASNAKAIYSDMADLRYVEADGLGAMVKSNPTDTGLVLKWAHKCMREGKSLPADCISAVIRIFPQILANECVETAGAVIIAIASKPGSLPSKALMDAAKRLELAGNCNAALKVYESILADPATFPIDYEGALFRVGLLFETTFNDPAQAIRAYEALLKRSPYGEFSAEAEAKLANLQKAM